MERSGRMLSFRARSVKRQTKVDGLLLTHFREGYNFQIAVVTRGLTARQARAPVSYYEHDWKRKPTRRRRSGWLFDFSQLMPASTIECGKPESFSFIASRRKETPSTSAPRRNSKGGHLARLF
jgi:hypothetical protein